MISANLPETRSRAVVVLGSHRSGTSAIAASLPLLGVDIGSITEHVLPQLDSAESNVKGFFEMREIVNYHDKLLAAMNLDYDSVADFPENWQHIPGVQSSIIALRNFIDRRFGSVPLWGFKDPRTCRFLSIWQSILDNAHIDDSYVLVVRNPLDVAKSLQRRNHLPIEKGLLLWLNHMIPAVINTANKPRVVVEYDKFLDDPEMELKKISNSLALEWPSNPMSLARFCQDFLDPNMRHYQSREITMSNISPIVSKAFKCLAQASRGDITSDTLTRSFLELDAAPKSLVMPYLRTLEHPSTDPFLERSQPLIICQVFFSTDGTTFNEKMSERIILESDRDQLHYCQVKLIARGHFISFRVDPINEPGIISDFNVSIGVEDASRYTELPFEDVRHFGVMSDAQGGWIAVGRDSQYYFDQVRLKPGDILRISFRYRLIDEEELVEAILATSKRTNTAAESLQSRDPLSTTDVVQDSNAVIANGAAIDTLRGQLSRLKHTFYELQSKDSEVKARLEKDNTHLLESVARLRAESNRTEARLFRELGQLSTTKETLERNLDQALKDNLSLSIQSSNELRDLRSGIEHLENELDRIRYSKAYQFILRFRQRLDRLAPEGSWRRRFYMRAIHKAVASSVQPTPAVEAAYQPVIQKSIFDMPLNNGRVARPQIKLTNTCSVRAIIPVYHPDKDFEQTLEMLTRQQDVQVDLMVIDSGRSQALATLVDQFGGKYLAIDKADFKHGASRNLGIDGSSENAYHFFTVQDAILSDRFVLARMVEFIASHGSDKTVACSGRTVPRSDADLFACWQIFNHYHSLGLQATESIDPMTLPLQKRLFYDNVIGMISSASVTEFQFSNELTYGEDVDLASRLVANGGSLGFVRDAVAIHSHVRTPDYYFRRGVLEGQTAGKYFGRVIDGLTIDDWLSWVSIQSDTWLWLKTLSRNLFQPSNYLPSPYSRKLEAELEPLRRSIEHFAVRWDLNSETVDAAVDKAKSSYVGSVLGLLASRIPVIEESVTSLTKGV